MYSCLLWKVERERLWLADWLLLLVLLWLCYYRYFFYYYYNFDSCWWILLLAYFEQAFRLVWLYNCAYKSALRWQKPVYDRKCVRICCGLSNCYCWVDNGVVVAGQLTGCCSFSLACNVIPSGFLLCGQWLFVLKLSLLIFMACFFLKFSSIVGMESILDLLSIWFVCLVWLLFPVAC